MCAAFITTRATTERTTLFKAWGPLRKRLHPKEYGEELAAELAVKQAADEAAAQKAVDEAAELSCEPAGRCVGAGAGAGVLEPFGCWSPFLRHPCWCVGGRT